MLFKSIRDLCVRRSEEPASIGRYYYEQEYSEQVLLRYVAGAVRGVIVTICLSRLCPKSVGMIGLSAAVRVPHV